jgi:hypothetical protein
MKNKVRFFGIITMAVIIMLSMVACKGKNLSGTYLPYDDVAKDSVVNSISFNKSGTCTIDLDFLGKFTQDYRIDGNTLTITIQGIGIPYEIQGDALVNQTTYGYEGTFRK